MHAWGQVTRNPYAGGWRYDWNFDSSDNSICLWPAIGMLSAKSWGCAVPQWMKDKNSAWLT